MSFGDAFRKIRRIISGSVGSPGSASGRAAGAADVLVPDPERLAEFKEAVKRGAANAFQATCADHADEQIYVFALYSDDDAITVCPAANSEEAYARKREGAAPADLGYLRWNTGDWAYEFEHVDLLDDAQTILTALVQPLDWAPPKAFRDQLFGAMVAALEELDTENVFGTGPARERITVFFTISDSADAERWEEYSVRRCNPPEVAERFLRAFTR